MSTDLFKVAVPCPICKDPRMDVKNTKWNRPCRTCNQRLQNQKLATPIFFDGRYFDSIRMACVELKCGYDTLMGWIDKGLAAPPKNRNNGNKKKCVWRKKEFASQQALADYLGWSKATVSKYVRENRINTLEKNYVRQRS